MMTLETQDGLTATLTKRMKWLTDDDTLLTQLESFTELFMSDYNVGQGHPAPWLFQRMVEELKPEDVVFEFKVEAEPARIY
jgi:hypothetical protein